MDRHVRDAIIVKVTAIVCLTAIAIAAINHGIDSVLLSTISAIVGGIAGYHLRGIRFYRKRWRR